MAKKEIRLADVVRVEDSVTTDPMRYVLDGITLALVGIVVSIGVSVGFGVGMVVPVGTGGAMLIGFGSGLAACALIVQLFRWEAARRWLHRVADYALRRRRP